MTTDDCSASVQRFIDDTLQLLQPDPPIAYTIAGESTIGAVTEHGLFPLTQGVNEYFVPFVTDKVSANYDEDELDVENLIDTNKLSIQASITSRQVGGFNVLLDAYPDSANYSLRWKVTVNVL